MKKKSVSLFIIYMLFILLLLSFTNAISKCSDIKAACLGSGVWIQGSSCCIDTRKCSFFCTTRFSAYSCKEDSACGYRRERDSCFPAGTQITMSDGSYKNIEDIQVNDLVKVFNEETKQVKIAPVKEISTIYHDNVHELHLENGIILKPTANHPFYVKDKGWATIDGVDELGIDSKKLEIGDYVYVLNTFEELEEIKVIGIIPIEGNYLTYNLVDMEYGTFLAEDVVVHNSDSTGSCGSYPNGYYDAPNCRRCRDGVWWFPDYSNNMPHCCQKFGCEPGCCAYVESCCGHEPSCFPPNTQITMSDGSYNNIEDVEVGDYVLSYDEETEQQVISEVLETEQPIHYHLYTLTFENNEILKTTREHPIYVENKGWASIDPDVTLATHNLVVEQLEIGDYVLNVNNELMKLVSLEYEEIPDGIQTYNLKTISNTNTYYAEGVLVHNKDDVIDEVIDDGCDEEGQPCGTCNSGRYDSNCNCVGDGCTYSPGCSPTSELRCNNGKQERRTRGTNCCGGCSGWSGWSVSDDCPSHDAWCRGNACVDCDTDLDICQK